MNHRPSSFERLAHGEQPAFLTQDATYNAGGLAEVHIVRGLNEPGTARLLVEAASERSAAALEASGFLGDRKRAIKSLTLRHFFLQSGRPVPEYLGNIRMPKPSEGRATELGVGFRTIWMYKRLEPEVMARIEPKLYETDLSSLADTSVEFFERYHTGYSFLMPAPLRRRVRAGLHAAGVYPYAERDYIDLETVRRYMAGFGMAAVSPSLRRPSAPPACWTPSAFDPLRLDV